MCGPTTHAHRRGAVCRIRFRALLERFFIDGHVIAVISDPLQKLPAPAFQQTGCRARSSIDVCITQASRNLFNGAKQLSTDASASIPRDHQTCRRPRAEM